MTFLIALGIFVAVVGSTWWFGLWNNVLTLINFFIAAMVASSFYENVAATLQESMPTYNTMLDFISLWLVFFLTFGFLRGLTEVLSPIRLKFNFWVDIAGRSIVTIWLAISFIFFAFFSMHLAPIPPSQYDLDQQAQAASPDGTKFLAFGPGRQWMAFIQSRSRGALAAGLEEPFLPEYTLDVHPDDSEINCRVFDPFSRLPVERQRIRVEISEMETLQLPE